MRPPKSARDPYRAMGIASSYGATRAGRARQPAAAMLETAMSRPTALITPRRSALARSVLWLSTPLVVYTSAAKPIASNGRKQMSGKRDLFIGGQWVAAKNKAKF